MRKYFKTDGIRGKANGDIVTTDLMLRLALATGTYLKTEMPKGHIGGVLIGKDTRLSGYMIESALVAGFSAVGMEVKLVGPMPTPAISMLTKSMHMDLGVMITASHNKYYDNGVKIFTANGDKLVESQELAIEKIMDNTNKVALANPQDIGRVKRINDANGRYIEFVKSGFNCTLNGLKIVIDCANGAGYKVAPAILKELQAEVIAIGVKPNGLNINEDCGATEPNELVKAVLANKADIGIAIDGDGDRLILVDHKGNIIDGDIVIGILAIMMKKNKQLKGPVITTAMSNIKLEHFLNEQGIVMYRSAVGDKYVSQAMKQYSSNLGGEQSGHIIVGGKNNTGDGIASGLKILEIMVKTNKNLYELSQIFTLFPQKLNNVPTKTDDFNELIKIDEVKTAINNAKKAVLKIKGRILLRPSGTEPVVRVMVEGEDKNKTDLIADELAAIITKY